MVLEAIQIDGCFPMESVYCEPVVRFGVWASGSAVRADTIPGREAGSICLSKVFDDCKRQHFGVIAVDKEAAAFYHGLSALGHSEFVAVKSVSNFADSHELDSFDVYGMRLAAAYALVVLREWSAKGESAHTSVAGTNLPGDESSDQSRKRKLPRDVSDDDSRKRHKALPKVDVPPDQSNRRSCKRSLSPNPSDSRSRKHQVVASGASSPWVPSHQLMQGEGDDHDDF
jgi:hypothetical protein